MNTFKRYTNWIESKNTLEKLLTSGATLEEAAASFGCTKQNISLVVKKHLPHLTKKDFGASKKYRVKRENKIKHIQEKYGRTAWYWADDLEKAHSDFFRQKKYNAKSTKWEWSIEYSDLEYPQFCPILGLELNWFHEARAENSPSIDRLDSTKGYIKGNVAVMSWRANRIKNNGTLQEHQMIVDYLSKLES